MSQINAMKQIGVKNMGFKVELMEWSNKMDLIAIGNEKGEVIIQRLNWQKICTFTSPGENIKVRAMSWQPDETVIAVGYSNGKVALLDVEKEDEIYSFTCDCDIKSLNWAKNNSQNSNSYDCNSDNSNENFLLSLPNLSSLSSTARKVEYTSSKSFTKNSPNFLVISLISGEICLSVFGVLPCGTINILKYVTNINNYEIYDVRMNATFEEIFIFVRDGEILKMLVFENDVLSKYTSSLLNLAMKYGNVLETLNYIKDTIQCIVEAWETVLLEMDNKLTKYANSQPEGSLSADFLELLMFGYPTEALEQFLTRDLTEKGLKKLGNSIELSYSTIQNLVVKPLHSAAVNLFFHLNIIKGLSRNTYCYRALLTSEATDNAISCAGGFLIKILELQQAIDQSVNDYKIFWCWLYVAIVRLMDESVPDEVASVTQEDITYLAEFLNNFDDCLFEKEDGTMGKRKFNLERVGQYLEDSNLHFPSKFDGNHQWNKLLEENECLRNCGLIYPHQKNFSLIQQHNLLKTNVRDLFAKPNKIIAENFTLKSTMICGNVNPKQKVITSYIANELNNCDMMVVSVRNNELLYIEFDTKCKLIKSSRLKLICSLFIQNKFKNFNSIIFKYLQFYNETTLSLLLEGTNENKISSYFVQLPLGMLRDNFSLHKIAQNLDLYTLCSQNNVLDFIDINNLKPVEGLSCSAIAVSGSRKVSSVLSDNCRKVRFYEMEIEEDDDEIEMSQNPLLDTSKDSVQSQE